MRRRGTAVAVLLGMLFVAGCGGAEAPSKGTGKKARAKREPVVGAPPVVPVLTRELRGALRASDFTALEAKLAGLQAEWESNPRTEWKIGNALYILGIADVSLETQYDVWVDSYPESALAHVARGCYRRNLSHRKRGSDVASETTREQFRAFDELGALGRADLKEALFLDPRCVAALWELSGDAHVSPDERRKYYEEARRLDPASMTAPFRYLWFLQPKWGGSMEEIEAVVRESLAHVKENPSLASLAGYAS